MKRITFFISDESYLRMMQNGDRRTAGRAWVVRDGSGQPVFKFEPYSHRQRVRVDQLLLSSEHGRLTKSAKRYRMRLSVPDHLGEQQAARVMMRESKRLTDFLHSLEQFLTNV
jgi:hypothetical protein